MEINLKTVLKRYKYMHMSLGLLSVDNGKKTVVKKIKYLK